MNSIKYGVIARSLGIISRDLMKEYHIKYYKRIKLSIRRWESMISGGKKNPTYLEAAENLLKIAEKYRLSQEAKDNAIKICETIRKSDLAALRTQINYLNTYNWTDEESETHRDYLSGFFSEERIKC